jgi:hypothetical protein
MDDATILLLCRDVETGTISLLLVLLMLFCCLLGAAYAALPFKITTAFRGQTDDAVWLISSPQVRRRSKNLEAYS